MMCVAILYLRRTCSATGSGPEVHKWVWKSWEPPAQSMYVGASMLFCSAELSHVGCCAQHGGWTSLCLLEDSQLVGNF